MTASLEAAKAALARGDKAAAAALLKEIVQADVSNDEAWALLHSVLIPPPIPLPPPNEEVRVIARLVDKHEMTEVNIDAFSFDEDVHFLEVHWPEVEHAVFVFDSVRHSLHFYDARTPGRESWWKIPLKQVRGFSVRQQAGGPALVMDYEDGQLCLGRMDDAAALQRWADSANELLALRKQGWLSANG